MPLLVKCRITCLRVTLRELFVDFVGWATHETVFSVACINNSDSEILEALQTVETVVRTQRRRLDADKFPMFSVGWNWQGFCRDLDPCWFE